METEGDYFENKIARGVYGVFGAAADEANKTAKQARDSVKQVKDAAKDAAKTAR